MTLEISPEKKKRASRARLPIETIRQTRYRTEDGHVHDTLHAARRHITELALGELLSQWMNFASYDEPLIDVTMKEVCDFMLTHAAELSQLLRDWHNLTQTQVKKP